MPEPGANESQDEFMHRCMPMMMDEGNEQDQAVAICMSKWREKKSMRQPGPITIKSQTDTEAIVAGYGVVFGGKDLEGETFTKETELELGYVPIKSIFYDHTLDAKANGSLGKTLSEEIDDVGVWVEAQIDRSKDYANAVLELVGQGTIAERIRAARAGIAAFYTPVGVGTFVGEGKEVREFDGRKYLLERALKADASLIRAHKADRYGNLVYKGSARTFNATMAGASTVTIAEVEEVVELGALDPEHIVTPGLYVQRVVVRPRGPQPWDKAM